MVTANQRGLAVNINRYSPLSITPCQLTYDSWIFEHTSGKKKTKSNTVPLIVIIDRDLLVSFCKFDFRKGANIM